MDFKSIDYTILNPTENITILVTDKVDIERQPEVASFLCDLNPKAEQVGFISKDRECDINLRMAAGEFCGNATMSAAAYLCSEEGLKDGEERLVRVSVSGTKNPVKVTIHRNRDIYDGEVEMPLPEEISDREFDFDGGKFAFPTVDFGGIVHVVIEASAGVNSFTVGNVTLSKADAERLIKEKCDEMKAQGMGFMFLCGNNLYPLVYVPGVGTCYWESSCASGTTAVGAVMRRKSGKEENLKLNEPGGILGIKAASDGKLYLSGRVTIEKTFKTVLVGINSKYIHSNPAVYSLASFVPALPGSILKVKEYTINQPEEEILGSLYSEKADLYAFSCYIWNIETVERVVKNLKKVRPDAKIWLGGPEVSYHPSEVTEKLDIDGIISGEGEIVFAELVEQYVSGTTDLTTPAILTGKPADMDSIPFWYEDSATGELDSKFENRILYYESSRGCPYCCSYCLSSIDKSVRFRSLELVFRDLDFFLRNNVKQVKFIDRTFNCNRERSLSIWNYIKEHDNGVTNFHFEIAGDILDEEEIMLLKSLRPGLVQLEIGVQSTNEKTLEAVNRKTDINKLKEVVLKLGEKKNIHLHTDLIAGLPYEDYESFKKSFNDVYEFGGNDLQLGFLKVLYGSPMEKDAPAHKTVYSSNPPYEVLSTAYISYDELLKLKAVEEMLEIYHNSGQFTKTVEFVVKLYPAPFDFYEALAVFYREKSYFTNTPSRAARYEVFFEFVTQNHREYSALCKELLIFDMYLRENLKSRPGFAPFTKEMSDLTYAFFDNENNAKYWPGYEEYGPKNLCRMMHFEFFFYPVWEDLSPENLPERTEEYAGGILFDYGKRNPVDSNVLYTPVVNRGGTV